MKTINTIVSAALLCLSIESYAWTWSKKIGLNLKKSYSKAVSLIEESDSDPNEKDSSGETMLDFLLRIKAPFSQIKSLYSDKNARFSTWRPTLGRIQTLEKSLNKGVYNGLPVYIHYTTKDGVSKILTNMAITDKQKGLYRPGSSAGVYIVSSQNAFSPENALNLLFLGNERYQDRDHVVVFAADLSDREISIAPVTLGSWVNEMRVYGDINISSDNLIYAGTNFFTDIFIER